MKLNLQAPWPHVKEKLKENDYRITDEDLDLSAGGEQELISRLAEKLGRSEQQVRSFIESISGNDGKAA